MIAVDQHVTMLPDSIDTGSPEVGEDSWILWVNMIQVLFMDSAVVNTIGHIVRLNLQRHPSVRDNPTSLINVVDIGPFQITIGFRSADTVRAGGATRTSRPSCFW